MAVNFGDTIMEGQIAPSVEVQSPVQDDSGATRAAGQAAMWEQFGNAANTTGKLVGSIFQQNQQNANASILTRYENDLLDLADAADQGADKNWVMIQARNLRRQYLANAPDLQMDFDKVWTNVVNSNGLGSVVVSGTLEQQAQNAKQTEAIKLGYPDLQSYEAMLAQSRQVQALADQLSIIQSQNGTVSETLKMQGMTAIVGLADKAFPAAQTQINKAIADIEAGGDKAAIVQQLNLTLGSNIQQLSAMGLNGESSFVTTPIQGLLDNFNKWADGGIELGILKNSLEITQAKYNAMFASDPVLGPFIAQSKLLESVGLNNSPLAQQILTPDVISRLRDATDPTKNLNILANDDASERFTQSVVEVAKTDLSGDPTAVEEFQQTLAGIVDGAYVNERGAQDGSLGFKGTVEVLGSNAVGEFIKEHGALPAQHADKFVEVLKNNYENEFVPVVQRYWESVPVVDPSAIGTEGANAGGISNIPMNQLLEPVWNGNAVEFVPRAEYANNPRIQSLAADVNTGEGSIGIPLNNLINAYANVSETDAKTVWEQQFAGQVFNLNSEGETDTGVMTQLDVTPPKETDLTLEQFNADEVTWTTPEEDTDLDIPLMAGAGIDMASLDSSTFVPPTENPAVNADVLRKFEGRRLPVSIRNNNMGAVSIVGDVASSWAARQPGFVGATPRPANEGGYYAQYATPEHGVGAASKLLERYGEQGVDTPATIVRKWSVDTAAHNSYANTLVKFLREGGIETTATTHLDLSNPTIRLAILKAKSAHESGAGIPVYNDNVFLRGVTYQF